MRFAPCYKAITRKNVLATYVRWDIEYYFFFFGRLPPFFHLYSYIRISSRWNMQFLAEKKNSCQRTKTINIIFLFFLRIIRHTWESFNAKVFSNTMYECVTEVINFLLFFFFFVNAKLRYHLSLYIVRADGRWKKYIVLLFFFFFEICTWGTVKVNNLSGG